MKAAIYNPYLDSLGGGERYTAYFAKVLHEQGYKVTFQSDDGAILDKLQNRFGINLEFGDCLSNVNKGENYDLIFWLSDGSIPLLKARHNILHFQMPFCSVNGRSLINKMKLYRINHVVCNSKFTKRYIDQEYGVDSKVLYPPIATEVFKPHTKENLILYVGRFSQLTQSKNQHILVDMFRKFYDSGNKDWKLVIAGGSGVGTGDYVSSLKESSRNYPVRIIENPSLSKLKELYGKSKIFWSASGYGHSQDKEPQKFEHFGITLVEAMSAKCVPVIYDGGGHGEIVTNGKNGYTWTTPDQSVEITGNLINDNKRLQKIAIESKISTKRFSQELFTNEALKLLS